MKPQLGITGEHIHHAYLIESDIKDGAEAVVAFLGDIGVKTTGNPDFHHYAYDNFLFEHAQMLRSEQSFHGSEGARKIFLVTFNTIMSEAQNALLKTLEEPTVGTHFFFVTKMSETLLPTVRSRMQLIRMHKNEDSRDTATDAMAQAFIRGDLEKRMEIITPLTKAKTDEKPRAKEDARVLLESLERVLYKEFQQDVGIATVLGCVLEARLALSERSPSLKILLEHIAVLCPRVKK